MVEKLTLRKTVTGSVREPLIAVVTPNLNHAQFLEQTINSVLQQNYQNFSYFVVDGASTDESLDIIRKYEAGLTGWSSQRDNGQSEAINDGWKKLGEADLFAWLNADDYFLPGAFQSIAEKFVECRSKGLNAGIFVGSGFKVNREGKILKSVEVNNINSRCPHSVLQFLQSSSFFSGDAIRQVGLLDQGLEYTMDWDLILRITKDHSSRYLDTPLSCQRIYDQTKTSRGGWQRALEIGQVGRRHHGFLDRNYLISRLFKLFLTGQLQVDDTNRFLRIRMARILQTALHKFIDPGSHMVHW